MRLQYESNRLILRILNYDFAPQVLQFYLDNRELFERYEAARPENFYTEDFQRLILNNEYNLAVKLSTIRFWVFERSHPDQIIGTVCFHGIKQSVFRSCQVGYKFDERYWHQGFATEALTLGMQIMFCELRLHRIEAYIMPSNIPSLQLVKRIGFCREGLVRHYAMIAGEWQDHYLYSFVNTQ